MPRHAIVAAALGLILAAALPAQRATFPVLSTVDHAAWCEIATPPGTIGGDRIAIDTDAGRTFRGALLERNQVADHWAILMDLPTGGPVTGTLRELQEPLDPFQAHPEVNLLQVLPIVVELTHPDGTRSYLPRVPIDGADVQVVESNPARLVLQARFSDGHVHGDVWVYVATMHPAVRFQAEVHYSALDATAQVALPVREVRFRWPNTPKPLELWSDAAALEGWELRGAEFRWRPPYRPQQWAARPADNPPQEHRLGWGERVLFDGMLLFGSDALSEPMRHGARFGPVTGVFHEWDGAFGALGGVPPPPTDQQVKLDWRVPGNIYSRRWLTLNFATNDAGFQQGFGDVGAVPIVAALRPELFRPVRLAAVDTALRPGHLRGLDGAPLRMVDHYPASRTLAGQPSMGTFGAPPGALPKFTYGQSGRRWGDDEHRRERELTAFLQLALDYQLRSVAASTMQVDLTQARRAPGWWGTTRNGGRRLLTMVELARVVPGSQADAVAYIDDLERALAGWEGGKALQANAAARELVVEVSADARGEVLPPHWSPWETARATSGCWAAYRYCMDRGLEERAERWRTYAEQLGRSVALTLVEVEGAWTVPYRVSYAGGVEELPAGWLEPGAATINLGSSDWLPWSRPALEVFVASRWADQRDAELRDRVHAALEWWDTNRPPRDWNDCAWVAGVRPPARK